jgi:putative membrane protein insertion efficiency factor
MITRVLLSGLRGYKRWISPLLPPACRYLPTCSEYAQEALIQHGVVRGSWLATRRLCRCHPWGGHGYDPVPLRKGEGQRAEEKGEGQRVEGGGV